MIDLFTEQEENDLMRPLLNHIKRIEIALNGLGSQSAFTFAASCAERVWPVYKKASNGKSWEDQELLRGTLNGVWDWLSGLSARPSGLASRCEFAVFDDDQKDPEDTVAYYVANSFFGLISIVENDQPQHAYQLAQSNLDILDAFLYDHLGLSVSSDSDMIVDNHNLMVKEMQRQIEDLNLLKKPLTFNIVSQIRNHSEGTSILDDFWYSAAG